jgi:hypothetical protein
VETLQPRNALARQAAAAKDEQQQSDDGQHNQDRDQHPVLLPKMSLRTGSVIPAHLGAETSVPVGQA